MSCSLGPNRVSSWWPSGPAKYRPAAGLPAWRGRRSARTASRLKHACDMTTEHGPFSSSTTHSRSTSSAAEGALCRKAVCARAGRRPPGRSTWASSKKGNSLLHQKEPGGLVRAFHGDPRPATEKEPHPRQAPPGPFSQNPTEGTHTTFFFQAMTQHVAPKTALPPRTIFFSFSEVRLHHLLRENTPGR